MANYAVGRGVTVTVRLAGAESCRDRSWNVYIPSGCATGSGLAVATPQLTHASAIRLLPDFEEHEFSIDDASSFNAVGRGH
jgi:hypothetical protein